ncbi:MAG: serine hydrolase, partial [Flavobacterium sp.]|nr:serine hydrolase [Flavobacterium sp.]
MSKTIFSFLIVLLFISCNSDNTSPTPSESIYFPPLIGDNWETKSFADLGWTQSEVQPLLDYLALKNSKGFIILVNGRIVMENYFNGHSASTP